MPAWCKCLTLTIGRHSARLAEHVEARLDEGLTRVGR
jgi:hypothetical protein